MEVEVLEHHLHTDEPCGSRNQAMHESRTEGEESRARADESTSRREHEQRRARAEERTRRQEHQVRGVGWWLALLRAGGWRCYTLRTKDGGDGLLQVEQLLH